MTEPTTLTTVTVPAGELETVLYRERPDDHLQAYVDLPDGATGYRDRPATRSAFITGFQSTGNRHGKRVLIGVAGHDPLDLSDKDEITVHIADA